MPAEYLQLKGAPHPATCPACGRPFGPFMRGQIHRAYLASWLMALLTRQPSRYCCLICEACKEVVGYEAPGAGYRLLRRYRRPAAAPPEITFDVQNEDDARIQVAMLAMREGGTVIGTVDWKEDGTGVLRIKKEDGNEPQ